MVPVNSYSHHHHQQNDGYHDDDEYYENDEAPQHFTVVKAAPAPPMDSIDARSSINPAGGANKGKSTRGIAMREHNEQDPEAHDSSFNQGGFSQFNRPPGGSLKKKEVSPAVDQW